jgi:hypothetical protein
LPADLRRTRHQPGRVRQQIPYAADACHERNRVGKPVRVDALLHQFANAIETFGGKAGRHRPRRLHRGDRRRDAERQTGE